MDTPQIVREVMRTVGLPREDAARDSVEAVLTTLARQVDDDALEGLVQRLPPELSGILEGARRSPVEDGDAFLDRVAQHMGNGHDSAMRHVRGVLRVLVEAVGQDAIARVTDRLPEDLQERLVTAPEAAHRDVPEYRPADHLARSRTLSEASGHLRSLSDVDDNPRGMSRRSGNERQLAEGKRNPKSLIEQ